MSDELSVLLARYPTQALAEEDFSVIRNMHNEGIVAIDDLAVVVKNVDGHVEITQNIHHGVFKGFLIGAILALLSPLSLVVGAVGGAAVGKIVRLMQPSLSRHDLKDLGEFLDESSVMIVVAGPPDGVTVVDEAIAGAISKMRKTVGADGETIRAVTEEHKDD